MSAQVFRAPRSIQPASTSGAGPRSEADLAADLAALTRVLLAGTPAAPAPAQAVETVPPALAMAPPITPTAPVGVVPTVDSPIPVEPLVAVEAPIPAEQVVSPAAKAAPGAILRELSFLDD